MKFSTEFVQQVTELFVTELEAQLARQEGVHIAQVESTLREMLRQVGGQCVSEYLTAQEPKYAKPAVSCSCGWTAAYLFRREAKILSVFGWVSYRRAYYICSDCHTGQCPLDQRLGLEPGQVSAGLAELLGIAGIQTSFGEASQLVKRFLLIEVSENTIRKESQTFGQLQMEREATWIAESQDPEVLQRRLRTCQEPPQRLYCSMDGAQVPLEEEWRELKTGCWYQVEVTPKHRRQPVGELGALRAKDMSYYCDLAQAQEFGHLLWATGCQRDADLAKEIVCVADGAPWIWKLVEHYFPEAVQIVDWYHAESYLQPIAKEAFAGEPEVGQQWWQTVRTDLWEGRLAKVISACARLENHPQAGEAAKKAVTYYTNNQHRMDYARFREAGYMIGSGTVESGCKQIVTQRLKRSGARWTEPGAVTTAKARAAWLSGDWDRLAISRSLLPLAT